MLVMQNGRRQMNAAKKITVSDEARLAIRRKPPTDRELVKWLNSNDEIDMPTSEQARAIAYALLAQRGYQFIY